MCSSDLILEKIQNLSEKIDLSSDHSKRELDAMNAHLSTINGNMSDLSNGVRKQNGRVSSLESHQKNCPGKLISSQFTQYQSDMKPVYILATNHKMIAVMVVGAALAFKFIDLGVLWILNLLSV